MRRIFPVLAVLAALPLAVVLALACGTDPVALAAREPLRERAADYEGAASCASCHPDHHASWARTFHASMTQLPGRDSVLGRFDGSAVQVQPALVRAAVEQVHIAEEAVDEGTGRMLPDVLRGAHLLDHAPVHQDHAISHLQRLLLVVRD